MTLFTIISLFMAVCGASYTSSIAFRNSLTKRVEKWLNEHETVWKEIDERVTNSHRANCLRWISFIKLGLGLWHVSHLCPVLMLLVLSSTIAFTVVGAPGFAISVDRLADVKPSQWMLTLLPWVVSINIICVVFTILGTWLIWFGTSSVKHHKLGMDEEDAKKLPAKGRQKRTLL